MYYGGVLVDFCLVIRNSMYIITTNQVTKLRLKFLFRNQRRAVFLLILVLKKENRLSQNYRCLFRFHSLIPSFFFISNVWRFWYRMSSRYFLMPCTVFSYFPHWTPLKRYFKQKMFFWIFYIIMSSGATDIYIYIYILLLLNIGILQLLNKSTLSKTLTELDYWHFPL